MRRRFCAIPAVYIEWRSGLLLQQAQMKVRRSIYTAQVVIWLMILQRLQPRGRWQLVSRRC